MSLKNEIPVGKNKADVVKWLGTSVSIEDLEHFSANDKRKYLTKIAESNIKLLRYKKKSSAELWSAVSWVVYYGCSVREACLNHNVTEMQVRSFIRDSGIQMQNGTGIYQYVDYDPTILSSKPRRLYMIGWDGDLEILPEYFIDLEEPIED